MNKNEGKEVRNRNGNTRDPLRTGLLGSKKYIGNNQGVNVFRYKGRIEIGIGIK